MREKIDRSIIEQYREQYEAGQITLLGISMETKISKATIVSYTQKKMWNKNFAHKNQVLRKKKIIIEKIEKFKEHYECGKIFQYQIAKEVKCDVAFLSSYIDNNWDKTENIKNLLAITKKNLPPITRILQKKGNIASQNTFLKRRKLQDKCKNFQIGKIFYTSEGLPLIFKGIKNGKPSVKHTLYTKHTYTNQEIKNFEK